MKLCIRDFAEYHQGKPLQLCIVVDTGEACLEKQSGK